MYYIVVLAFTAVLGLICVKQVNTHCCFVLAYPHLANTCPFFYVSKFVSRTCQCVVHFVQCFHVIVYHVQDIQVYISHSVVIVSHHIDTVHILCWLLSIVALADTKNPPFITVKFDWTKPNLYYQFKIFSKKVKFAFGGQFKDSDNKVKVGCILNWLGDEAFLIYDNLSFKEPAHKDLPDKVLEAFSNNLKPERNVFHSWYTLGSIYSDQFKSQSDFYNHLQCVAKECNFSSHDEVVKFLFLTHNNNTRVCEDLLKEMKEDTTLATMLNTAQISEGTIHSKELSKQYLDTIKVSNKQVDSVKKSRSK